jgi:sorbitol-specific phosphotransferase system component IIBC
MDLFFLIKEIYMNSITDSTVIIQTTSHSVPSTPSRFGEMVVIAQSLRRRSVPAKISERAHFARRRFGRYEIIDFLAVLFGYAVSGERTLEAFYKRVHPFAATFMALFGRDRLPARSTLSRFLAALTPEAHEDPWSNPTNVACRHLWVSMVSG